MINISYNFVEKYEKGEEYVYSMCFPQKYVNLHYLSAIFFRVMH